MSGNQESAVLADLLEDIKQIQTPRGAAEQSLEDHILILKPQRDVPRDGDTVLKTLIPLILHLHQSWQSQSEDFNSLIFVLAEATKRQPLLRSLFGLKVARNDLPYQSILHAVISILSKQGVDNNNLVNSCLRIVANCCADNNSNRRFVLEHDVMRCLIDLAVRKVEIDTLIPVIYNICNDYEDPESPSIENPESSVSRNELPADEAAAIENTSYAVRRLATASPGEAATFQILLTLTSCCSEDRSGLLAELVELAATPIQHILGPIVAGENATSIWHFEVNGQQFTTLEAALALANCDSECRVFVIRAMLHLLSSDHAYRSLLSQGSGSVWQLIRLVASENGVGVVGDDEFAEDLGECRKQFLKLFYRLIAMPEFAPTTRVHESLLQECVSAMSTYVTQTGPHSGPGRDSQDHIFIICTTIMLAQIGSSEPIREKMLHSEVLVQGLQQMLITQEENDVLYPAVTLIGRLSLTSQPTLPFMQPVFLHHLQGLLSGQGRGLVLPFETVHTLRVMIRNRMQYLPLYFANTSSGDDNVISAVTTLFDKTIEAGTKLEVGHFIIELLRMVFPLTKDLGLESSNDDKTVAAAFSSQLDVFATKFVEVMTFVCTQAEPAHQRLHGWFGLGMLSVWKQGRDAIVHFVEQGSLNTVILEVASGTDGPAQRNLKVILSKIQECQQDDLPVSVTEIFDAAAQKMGLQLVF